MLDRHSPVKSVSVAYFFISKMDKQYKSVAQIATGFTTDDAVKLNDGPSNPFDINTNFNNIIESMNSVPVLTLVSYRLIMHDLKAIRRSGSLTPISETACLPTRRLSGQRPCLMTDWRNFQGVESIRSG